MTPISQDQLADLITALALTPDLPRLDGISDADWATAGRLAGLERELRVGANAAPPLHQDKTAATLGLIPDPAVQLDPARLRTARTRAGLSIADLAEHLTARGWEVTTAQVFRWETQPIHDLPPALIAAVTDELGAPDGTLLRSQPAPATRLSMTQEAVRGLVDRFAAVLGLNQEAALGRLNAVAVAAVHRGEQPQEEELLHRLDLFVTTLEQRHGS